MLKKRNSTHYPVRKKVGICIVKHSGQYHIQTKITIRNKRFQDLKKYFFWGGDETQLLKCKIICPTNATPMLNIYAIHFNMEAKGGITTVVNDGKQSMQYEFVPEI
jgi:hypothetical protein